eukprot:Gb_35917 [translate_table: standard]
MAGEGKWRRELAWVTNEKNEDCLVLPVVSVPLEDGSVFKKNEKNPPWGEKQVFSPLYWFSSLRGGLGAHVTEVEVKKGQRVSRGGPAQAAAGWEGSRGPARPCSGLRRMVGTQGEMQGPTEARGRAPGRGK